MRFNNATQAGLLFYCLIRSVSASAAGTPPLHLMLTSFDPFGGSSANNTQPIVNNLQSNAGQLGPGVAVDVCNLPVEYDRASQVAMNCVDRYRPDVVVSFGEADCAIRIESAATNWDDTPGLADNAGVLRSGSPIIAGDPERSAFNFPVETMYCALTNPELVKVSVDPGAFVCNNTAYRLSQEFRAKKTPFTFIHVPNSRCPGGGNPVATAATILQMLTGAIQNLRLPLQARSPWPHPGSVNLLPTDAVSTQVLERALETENAPSCERDYARALATDYAAGN